MTKLSIAILTRNRPEHLAICCDSIKATQSLDKVAVRVFDNASSPPVKCPFPVVRHNQNIGFVGNYKSAVDMAVAEGADYLWIIPDDKKVAMSAIWRIFRAAESRPDLIVVPQSPHRLGEFYDIRGFLESAHKDAPELLLSAGHLGCVVFRPAKFNYDWFNRTKDSWSYPHLPAVMHDCHYVVVIQQPQLEDILPRCPACDNDYPAASADWNWRKCIEYLNGRFNTQIDLLAESKRMNAFYRRRLLREPHKLIWENRRELLTLSRWPTAISRLFKAVFHNNV